jgi:hypothetical protein
MMSDPSDPSGSADPGAPHLLPEPSLATLFGDLARQTGTLVRKEVELAQVEMTAKATDAAKKAIVVAGGGIACAIAALVLLGALVLGLGTFMPLWVSALIVGLVVAFIGIGVAFWGLNALKRFDPVPRATIQTVKETKLWAEQQMAR